MHSTTEFTSQSCNYWQSCQDATVSYIQDWASPATSAPHAAKEHICLWVCFLTRSSGTMPCLWGQDAEVARVWRIISSRVGGRAHRVSCAAVQVAEMYGDLVCVGFLLTVCGGVAWIGSLAAREAREESQAARERRREKERLLKSQVWQFSSHPI